MANHPIEPRDLIIVILDQVMKTTPAFTQAMALTIETNIRHEFGGEEVYIAKSRQVNIEIKDQAVSDYISGKPIKEIVHSYGLSRASLYRHLKK